MRARIPRRVAALLAVVAAVLGCRAEPPEPGVVVRNRVEYALRPPADRFPTHRIAVSRVPYRKPTDPCRLASLRDTILMGEVTDAYLERGVAVICPLRSGGPAARVVVRGHGGIPSWADVYLPATADTPVQRLELEISHAREYYGGAWVEGEDLNGDGWTDLKVQGTPGPDFNSYSQYSVFVYDPGPGRFVRAEGPSGKAEAWRDAGQACAHTSRGPSGVWIFEEWCWRGGRFVLRKRRIERPVRTEHDTVHVQLDSIYVPRNGRLELVEIDTVRVF
jgi:hypothetical protein